jgi:diaminopimelate epimerase
MQFYFYKFQGTGNDFVIVDGTTFRDSFNEEQIKKICNRRFGIGADGLMLYLPHADYDFEMKYFNADGNESTMCGNGGRCLSQFAHLFIKPSQYQFTFLAIDGVHESTIETNNIVKLKMLDVNKMERNLHYNVLNTGSPHLVKLVNNLDTYAVKKEGAYIRNSEPFLKEGINVNFVEQMENQSKIFVRTYERGVEDETLSCGTGVTAAALVCAHNENGFNHVAVQTLGGKLYVEFDNKENTNFTNIWLCGAAKFVYKGQMEVA